MFVGCAEGGCKMCHRKGIAAFCILAVFASLPVSPGTVGAAEAFNSLAEARGVTSTSLTTEQKNEALIKAAQNPIAAQLIGILGPVALKWSAHTQSVPPLPR